MDKIHDYVEITNPGVKRMEYRFVSVTTVNVCAFITFHHSSHCVASSLSATGSWQNVLHCNTLRPRQNCCHFADDISKYIFLKENV